MRLVVRGSQVVIVSACSVYIDSAVTSLITERRWALPTVMVIATTSVGTTMSHNRHN